MEDKKYIKPLRKCYEILKQTEGVNYIILCADVTDDSEPKIAGGSGWNIKDGDTSPDFFSMVGGLVEHFLNEQDLSYMEKISLIKDFHGTLLKNLTGGKEK